MTATRRKTVVLDDDPTGTQTVHDVAVLTDWAVGDLAEEFTRDAPLFFVLTNSRSLPPSDARALADRIGHNLRVAADRTGVEVDIISRGDSTLRGHYPDEVDALTNSLGWSEPVHVLCPFFAEGGRVTIDDVHYIADGDQRTPVGETEFARDAQFGFRSSHLADWVVEKSDGRIDRSRIRSVGLDDLREQPVRVVAERLAATPPGGVVIVNAAVDDDVRRFVAAVRSMPPTDRRFIFRTAAGFVRAWAGLDARESLDADDIRDRGVAAGLIIVGSHVPRTTAQLRRLVDAGGIESVELSIDALVADVAGAVDAAADRVSGLLAAGRHVVLSTPRRFHADDADPTGMRVGRSVRRSLVDIVRQVKTPLRFLVAKGGITSSDIATDSLGVRRAVVMGQALPGVPVWRLGDESRRPGTAYVVFPGNVGDDVALLDLFNRLK